MKNPCKKCGLKGVYSEEWDAYYCQVCNEWIESKCDRRCCYCDGRPEKPLEGVYEF